jgi:hypothetical protein
MPDFSSEFPPVSTGSEYGHFECEDISDQAAWPAVAGAVERCDQLPSAASLGSSSWGSNSASRNAKSDALKSTSTSVAWYRVPGWLGQKKVWAFGPNYGDSIGDFRRLAAVQYKDAQDRNWDARLLSRDSSFSLSRHCQTP